MASSKSVSTTARVALALVLLAMLAIGCSAAVETSGDPTPDVEQVDGGAGAASMPTPVDRACTAAEQGYVSAAGLSLTESGCTEVVNNSGISGGRAWCCAGRFAAGTTEP